MKLKELERLLFRKDLFCIHGMKTELGYKTKRKDLSKNNINELCEWLRIDKRNSLKFVFDGDETINFK